MIDMLQRLVAALREELQQYGEMLALLEKQQDYVVARATPELYDSIGAIQVQASTILKARAIRDQCREQVEESHGLAPGQGFQQLLPLLPHDYRGLIHALVQENNESLYRIQQRVRQNHLLLSRSLEFMQSLISHLLPGFESKGYTDHGTRIHTFSPTRSLYEAVG